MAVITIGIGEWAVSSNPEDSIKTFALGSCVAAIIFDSKEHLAGMIHVALPESSIDPARARTMPGYFADTGLPFMIEEMKRRGATRGHVWVKLAGGASMLDPGGIFDIGKRNVIAVKRVLWKSALGPLAEDVGGEISRTVTVSVMDGGVSLSSSGREWIL
jgi:chemotaxis protein CheD